MSASINITYSTHLGKPRYPLTATGLLANGVINNFHWNGAKQIKNHVFVASAGSQIDIIINTDFNNDSTVVFWPRIFIKLTCAEDRIWWNKT